MTMTMIYAFYFRTPLPLYTDKHVYITMTPCQIVSEHRENNRLVLDLGLDNAIEKNNNEIMTKNLFSYLNLA
jgi:hypothetical protein